MDNIYVFSQNVKLDSLIKRAKCKENSKTIFITTHKLFPNEREFLESYFENSVFFTFADFISDKQMQECDERALENAEEDLDKYYANIKILKNQIIVKKVCERYKEFIGYIFSNDLGISRKEWEKKGFRYIKVDEYYKENRIISCIKGLMYQNACLMKFIYKYRSSNDKTDVYVSQYNGKKIIFVGKMDRIEYRFNIKFERSEVEAERYIKGEYYEKEECMYISTLHECGKCHIPDSEEYDVRYIQDGYLPANYSSFYLRFKPKNVEYYAWDELGKELFVNQKLPVSILPFRKRLYLKVPNFPKEIRRVLVTASGTGDWTALKNRSDDDNLVLAFIEIASKFPNIQFVYRCHPTWTHPNHVGVHSIDRVCELIKESKLKNIVLSGNIPKTALNSYQLSFTRSSLEEDLENTDMVFGEHSISMIDAALNGILFCSVNLTNRRNFFEAISKFGFPHCENIVEIEEILVNCKEEWFHKKYIEAIKKYNEMTDFD